MIDLTFLLKVGFIHMWDGFTTGMGLLLMLLVFQKPIKRLWK